MEKRFRNLPLNPLRAFAIASRHKTFTEAARYMGVSQVAISRQVTTLEEYLDVKLFERGTRSVRLTEMGRALSFEVAGLFDELENAANRVFSDENNNTIFLRTYPTVAHHWLLPRLPDFRARFPAYRVRLDTRVAPLDFRGTHLDVALQLGRGDWADTRSRKLMSETVDAVCSTSYLDRIGKPATPEDIPSADLLHARYRRQEWEQWATAVGADVNDRDGLYFDSSLLVYSACMAGLGVAVGQLELLKPNLDSGLLVQPFNSPIETGAAFHVVWPKVTSVQLKTRHFIDWLLDQTGEPPEFFGVTSAPRN